MTTDHSAIDAVFDALADHQRRALLAHLQDAGAATVEELATVVRERPGESGRADSGSRVVVRLHHVHLPKLEAADLVAYDRERDAVTYVGNSTIAALLAAAPRGPLPE